MRHALPILFRQSSVGLGFALDSLENLLCLFIRIASGLEGYLKLIPKPLIGGRKIKIVALDGEAVDKRHPPSGRMTVLIPVAYLEQHGSQQADFDHFAADSFNLDPIADVNAVSA